MEKQIIITITDKGSISGEFKGLSGFEALGIFRYMHRKIEFDLLTQHNREESTQKVPADPNEAAEFLSWVDSIAVIANERYGVKSPEAPYTTSSVIAALGYQLADFFNKKDSNQIRPSARAAFDLFFPADEPTIEAPKEQVPLSIWSNKIVELAIKNGRLPQGYSGADLIAEFPIKIWQVYGHPSAPSPESGYYLLFPEELWSPTSKPEAPKPDNNHY